MIGKRQEAYAKAASRTRRLVPAHSLHARVKAIDAELATRVTNWARAKTVV